MKLRTQHALAWILLLSLTVFLAGCTKSAPTAETKPGPARTARSQPTGGEPAPEPVQTPAAAFSEVETLDSPLVERFLTSMDAAFQKKDASFLRDHIASDALIVVRQGELAVQVDKGQYLQTLAKAWDKIDNYRYERTEPAIAIQDDLANVHYVVHESGQVLGKQINAQVDTLLELKLQDSKVLITYVQGRSEMSIN